MTPRERELTGPVALLDADGRLARDAIGFARRPVHDGPFAGPFGRKKQWDYWCVIAGEAALAFVVADVDYLGLAAVSLFDFRSRRVFERAAVIPGALGFSMPREVGATVRHDSPGLHLAMDRTTHGTHLRARARTLGGDRLEADVHVALPDAHETIDIAVPFADGGFQLNAKHAARPARGEVRALGRTLDFGEGAFGCLDWGRGVWPWRTTWNWSCAQGIASGRAIGLNFGAKWTDGSGATENGVTVDGKLHKIGEDVVFDYDRRDFTRPWTIRTPSSDRVRLLVEPFWEIVRRADARVLRSELHLVWAKISGEIVLEDGERLVVTKLVGWAEEHVARW